MSLLVLLKLEAAVTRCYLEVDLVFHQREGISRLFPFVLNPSYCIRSFVMPKAKFFAVCVGREGPRIYETWAEVSGLEALARSRR